MPEQWSRHLSYNGSGTFNINTAGQPVVTGTVISSTAFNALTADLATGLSTAITKDGQTTTTARIVFAQGVSSTLTTDATSATTGSIITAGGISTQKALWVGTTSRLVGAVQMDAALTYGGVTLSNSVTGTGSMVLSASPTLTGTLAVPTIAATSAINLTLAQNTGTYATINNTDAGGAASSWFRAQNGTHIGQFGVLGTGYTTSGVLTANAATVYGTSDVAIASQNGVIKFAAGSTSEVARLTSSGLGIGMTPSNALDVTGAASVLTNGAGASGSRVSHNASASSGGSYTQYYKDLTPSYVAGIGTCVPGGSAASALIFSEYTGSWTERMRLTSAGLGIGMTPSNVLDITQNQNSFSIVNILNSNAGTASQAGHWASNGTNSARYGVLGTGYSSTGTFQAGYGLVYASSGLGICAGGGPILFGSNGTAEKARIDTNGYLLVGYTASNGAYLLQVNSQIFATNATIATSDGRYKEDIADVENALDAINVLRPVTFKWKTHPVHNFDVGATDIGFIAQDVRTALNGTAYVDQIIKENTCVLPDKTEEGFLGLADSKLIPLLVAAIKELNTRLAALEKN